MQRTLIRTTFVAAVLLAGCGGSGYDSGSRPGATGAGGEVPLPAAGTPPPAAALAGDMVVSTNEPFWQARVEGREVVLDGPDVQGRRFRIDSDEEMAGVRVVVASDAGGGIALRISPPDCQDSMSGARFPLTGELEIDSARGAEGCARPAGMPPPRPTGD